MYFQQVYDKTLSQASYFIGCQETKEAMVIDARRDVDVYLEIVSQQGMKITHVAETHIHADFLAGSRELSALTGAKLYLSDEGGADWQYQFDHIGLKNGDVISLGNLSLEVMHTPGHTPESISFLLRDHPATDEPVMVFTGDFLFVGDVGRPDLLEVTAGQQGAKEEGARALYESLKRFAHLPDYVQIWPGHGAGSACGKALGAVANSTVGYEKIRNWAFQFRGDFEGFKQNLLADQPEVPTYFGEMKKRNRLDRTLLTEVPQWPILTVQELPDEGDYVLIDTRHKDQFAAGHLPGAINLQNNNSLANWAGWLVPYDTDIIIVAQEDAIDQIARKLMRIGLDRVRGVITNLSDATLVDSKQVDLERVEEWKEQAGKILLDVRSRNEYRKGHIPGAQHYFLGQMADTLPEPLKDKTLIIHCQSGDRASIAASYLEKHGFEQVYTYPGSYLEWTRAGKPTVQPS